MEWDLSVPPSVHIYSHTIIANNISTNHSHFPVKHHPKIIDHAKVQKYMETTNTMVVQGDEMELDRFL